MQYYQNPYLGYYPVMQQPVMYPQQTVAEPQQQPQQSNDTSYFIWVQGEAGAKSYPVARGTTVPLFDSEGDFVYIKTVDNNGVPLPLITKVLSDPVKPQEHEDPEPKTSIDMSQYVTKEKYEELENRVLELETRPIPSTYTSNFTGNTFNNSRKGKDDGGKLSV